MTNIELINEELKRLHDLLTLNACDKEMTDKVLRLIENLHESSFYPNIFIPDASSDGWSIK